MVFAASEVSDDVYGSVFVYDRRTVEHVANRLFPVGHPEIDVDRAQVSVPRHEKYFVRQTDHRRGIDPVGSCVLPSQDAVGAVVLQ